MFRQIFSLSVFLRSRPQHTEHIKAALSDSDSNRCASPLLEMVLRTFVAKYLEETFVYNLKNRKALKNHIDMLFGLGMSIALRLS